MPRLSCEKKNEIVKLWQENLSICEIMKVTGVAKSTICYTLKKFRQIGTTENGKSTGRPPKLSYREEKSSFFCQDVIQRLQGTFRASRSNYKNFYRRKKDHGVGLCEVR